MARQAFGERLVVGAHRVAGTQCAHNAKLRQARRLQRDDPRKCGEVSQWSLTALVPALVLANARVPPQTETQQMLCRYKREGACQGSSNQHQVEKVCGDTGAPLPAWCISHHPTWPGVGPGTRSRANGLSRSSSPSKARPQTSHPTFILSSHWHPSTRLGDACRGCQGKLQPVRHNHSVLVSRVCTQQRRIRTPTATYITFKDSSWACKSHYTALLPLCCPPS